MYFDKGTKSTPIEVYRGVEPAAMSQSMIKRGGQLVYSSLVGTVHLSFLVHETFVYTLREGFIMEKAKDGLRHGLSHMRILI